MTESEHVVSRFDLAEMTDDRAAKIEAMAEALCDFDVDNNGGYVWGHRGDSWGSDYENGRDYYREMADAALGALQLWEIDATLDSVHPEMAIRHVWRLRSGKWEACISVPDGPDDDGWYDYIGSEVVGTGPTRIAAIRDAVAKAKGEQQ